MRGARVRLWGLVLVAVLTACDAQVFTYDQTPVAGHGRNAANPFDTYTSFATSRCRATPPSAGVTNEDIKC